MTLFEPNPGEEIVLNIEGIASASNPLARGELVLTTRDIVFARETGMFTKKTEVTRYPVSWVQLREDGLANIEVMQPAVKGADFALTVQFAGARETFLFPSDRMSELGAWVECLNELVGGTRVAFDPASMKTLEVGKAVQDALDKAKPMVEKARPMVEKAKPMAAKAAQAARPYLPMAAELLKKNPKLVKFGKLADMGVFAADALDKAVSKAAASTPQPGPATQPGAAPEPHQAATNVAAQGAQGTQGSTGQPAASAPAAASVARPATGTPTAASAAQHAAASTPVLSLEEQIEAVKKLKELLDAGILTQEEFDTKKRQVMGL